MALIVDWTGALAVPPYKARITIPFADLITIAAPLYELDTDAFRLELTALLDDVDGMPFHDTHTHTTDYTIAGVNYARAIAMLSEVQFEDTGSAYSVRLAGSNNDIFDQEGGIFVPTPLVTVIGQNSAGLVVTATSGLTASESAALIRIDDGVFGQKIVYETIDPAVYPPGSGVPGYIELYDDAATPVIVGHKEIWSDNLRTKGWESTDPMQFEGPLKAGAKP